MNGFTLTITEILGTKSSNALRGLGALLAAAAVVSMPLVAAGGPTAAGRATPQVLGNPLAAAGLPAEDEVEEACAAADEATAEACAKEEEATAATLPAEEVESDPQARAPQSAARADESCPAYLGNDGFGVGTFDGEAGAADFVDYGEGKPGGGNNDDYIAIHDLADDNEGIKAYAWISLPGQQGDYLGSRYNGEGNGSCIVWDPFPNNNVKKGQCVGLMVCRVNGPDGAPYDCGEDTVCSSDG